MICTWGLRRHQRLVGRACWEPFLFLFRWTGGVTLPILASTQTSEMADVWVHDLPTSICKTGITYTFDLGGYEARTV